MGDEGEEGGKGTRQGVTTVTSDNLIFPKVTQGHRANYSCSDTPEDEPRRREQQGSHTKSSVSTEVTKR